VTEGLKLGVNWGEVDAFYPSRRSTGKTRSLDLNFNYIHILCGAVAGTALQCEGRRGGETRGAVIWQGGTTMKEGHVVREKRRVGAPSYPCTTQCSGVTFSSCRLRFNPPSIGVESKHS
jgi:hypothetical protein